MSPLDTTLCRKPHWRTSIAQVLPPEYRLLKHMDSKYKTWMSYFVTSCHHLPLSSSVSRVASLHRDYLPFNVLSRPAILASLRPSIGKREKGDGKRGTAQSE